jgi:RHS repeat-associated protein
MANTKGSSVISNPQGGGAQSGLGEKFSPDLFTGTGNFSVPIAVPPGRNGFQPELTLGYSSGNGNGVFGSGWALGIPGVMRKTSKGIPVYDDRNDIFILSGAEDLVPVNVVNETLPGPIGVEKTYYRPRTEGLFARIIRYKKTNGEHYWEVRSKDGLISYYGTLGAVTDDPAIIADPGNRKSIFAWHLTKTVDPFGNEIIYNYTRDLVTNDSVHNYDQLYVSSIQYAQFPDPSDPDITRYLCEVRFIYEDRPDAFSAYRQGFEVRTTQRCIKIETWTNPVPNDSIKTKTYHFNYKTELPLNGASVLGSVSVEGHPAAGSDEESEFMPPLEFSYSAFDPVGRELKEISGPLPVNSIAEPGYELVDVTGNGLPDLLQLNGTARYWTNKGNGKFSPPRELNLSPSVLLPALAAGASAKAEGAGLANVRFIDSNGDGRTDLLVHNNLMSGYFPGAFHKVWDNNNFRPFQQTPSFSFEDPEVQLIDLDGDGITDVLRNGDRFECFYNHPEKGFYKVRTAEKLFANFSFNDSRIRFADMTGDGLQDIVLISSGRVQYWPNMGYGRFGRKVNMKNAPVFPEQYDPSQVLIGDLDGDGQADIAFIENNKITLYINQSGNGFSDPVKIINTPRIYNLRALRIIDIMGTGQAGLLWSFGPDAGTPGKMFFLDFTKGNKPYVLEQMSNNMGSVTRVKYGSSVYHYLRDESNPSTRWKTDLPFPVQVVDRVEVLDLLSGGKLVTEYKYHNGYWDGVEREFRGFAHVDSFDSEEFTPFNTQNLFENAPEKFGVTVNTVAPEHYSPPVMTKSWFYVGPVGDGFSRWKEPDFSNEYWSGDVQLLQRPLSMKNLLAALPRRARRDALRTLRGTLLRSELYALDKSILQDKPYTVTESLMSVRMEFDPTLPPGPFWSDKSGYWSGGGYIFFPFNIAQRTSQYERGTDPMHSFSFTKSYDDYGQAKGQLSVAVPRGGSPISGGNGNYLSTFSFSDFIYADTSNQYMVNRVKRSLGWDLTQSASGKSVFALRDDIFSQFDTDPLTITFPVISCTLNYYDKLGTPFAGQPYGQMDDTGALVRSEILIVTESILDDAYGAGTHPQCFKNTPNWTTGYPTAFAGLLQNGDDRLGYTYNSGAPYVDGWYGESARLQYDSYGMVIESKDVFDNRSTVSYDAYNVLPVSSRQYLNLTGYLETTADYDYRVMQPYQVKDVNDNYSEFDFSPLGLLRATALIGKGTEGDYKSASGDFYSKYEPSVKMEYDFFAFAVNKQPVWVKTVSREKHYQDSATSDTITKVEYSDGFGRLLQTRVQAEDVIFGDQVFGSSGLPADQSQNDDAVGTERSGTDPLNVVVSGWKIYNNKGKVVEQYEPFFDKDFDYVTAEMNGVRVRMYYDALGRVVRTKNPNESEQWVFYGTPNDLLAPVSPLLPSGIASYTSSPWISFTYDSNDLAPITNPTGSNVPSSHEYTPKSSEVDALGRTIKTTEHIDKTNTPPIDNIVMQYTYDIRGNLLLVKDPYDRAVFTHVYDLRTPGKDKPLPPLRTIHIDKGDSNVLFDVLGKPIESHDAKGAVALSAYDRFQRHVYSWAANKTGDTITLRNYMVYGETAGSTNNLNGKAYQSYDEAGYLETPAYDFKGNLLTKNRQVIDSTVLKSYLSSYTTFVMDWDSPPTLDSTIYETDMEYDALNRITRLTLPTDLGAERKQIIPTYNTAGALEKVDLYKPTPMTTTNYVENIVYNAKGQRLLIAFGNGAMTRYVYDKQTFRLLRQRTEKYLRSVSGSTVTYAYTSGSNKQDDGFDYDLVGNIVTIFNRVTDCGISGTLLGDNALNRNFEYDAIYRLTYADGRESNTQNNSYYYSDATIPSPADATTAQGYQRNYDYDKLGNINSVVQSGVNGFTRSYTYNTGVNTLQKIEDGTPSLMESYTYDSCGNTLTTSLTRSYYWNHADQLICYKNGGGTPSVFTQYDYSGQERVSKLVRTGTDYERTIYIDGIFEYVKLESGSTYEKNYIHIMDDKSRIAEVRINPGSAFPTDITDDIIFHIEDQIGSSVLRLSTTATVIDQEEYYPFGDASYRTFTYKRYRYVGKEKDQESGLYYYGARYYASWTCRFISVDPLAAKYAHLSPYNYADNNPINDFDIDGMQNNNTMSVPTTGGGSVPTGGGTQSGTGGGSTNQGGGSSQPKGPSTPVNDGPKMPNINFSKHFPSAQTSNNPRTNSPKETPATLERKVPPALPTAGSTPDLRSAPSGGSAPQPTPPDPYSQPRWATVSEAPKTFWQEFSEGAKRSPEGMLIYGTINQFYIWYNWTVHRSTYDLADHNVGRKEAESASFFGITSLFTLPLGPELKAVYDASKIAQSASGAGSSQTTVIGRMDDLIQFDKDPLIDTWRKSGIPGKGITWPQNRAWLDARIARGDRFGIATNPNTLPPVLNGYIPGVPNGYFTAREFDYLMKQGVSIMHMY